MQEEADHEPHCFHLDEDHAASDMFGDGGNEYHDALSTSAPSSSGGRSPQITENPEATDVTPERDNARPPVGERRGTQKGGRWATFSAAGPLVLYALAHQMNSTALPQGKRHSSMLCGWAGQNAPASPLTRVVTWHLVVCSSLSC